MSCRISDKHGVAGTVALVGPLCLLRNWNIAPIAGMSWNPGCSTTCSTWSRRVSVWMFLLKLTTTSRCRSTFQSSNPGSQPAGAGFRPDLLHGLRIKSLIPPPGKAVHQDVILPAQQELKCFCVVPSKIAPVPLPDMVSVPIVRVSFGGCQPVLCRFSHTEMQEVPAESAAHPGFLSLRPNML